MPAGVVEVACSRCGKRLLDYLNRIEAGNVIVMKRCRHCKTMNEVAIQAPR